MGRGKEILIQMDEDEARGYSIPQKGEKFLCAHHFSNEYIKDYIRDHGSHGKCSYCKREECVIDLADFVKYVGGRLFNYLEDINDAGLFLESSIFDDGDEEIPGIVRRCGFAAPSDADFYESNGEAMEDFGLVTDSGELNEDLSSNLYLENKIRRNPTSLLLSDELSLLWNQFCDLVKTKQRYTFFRSSQFDVEAFQHSSNGLSDILTELGSLVWNIEDKLPLSTTLYRCRPAKETDKVTSFADVTAPPVAASKTNRLSPSGISMFYGSFDKETPLIETRAYATTPLIYRASFEIARDLRVINLCNIPVVDFWMPSGWQEYSFLSHFHQEMSKPLSPQDNPDIEYIPSQIFTEYLRCLCLSSAGKPYDGIIYQSAQTMKPNIVLFYDNKTSADVLQLSGPIELVYSNNDSSVSSEEKVH